MSRGIGIICKARKFYYSFIQLYMTSCIEVWGGMSKLFLIQYSKKAVGIITYSPATAHSVPIFHKLKILPVENLLENLFFLCVKSEVCNRLFT